MRRWLLGFVVAAVSARFAAADAYDPPTTYYSSATGSGAALLTQLRTITSVMDSVSYADARYSAPYTDADPNIPGNILLIYNRASVDGQWSTTPLIWNREHIWPQSRLGSASDSDQFNLRPANPTINSTRGNDPFGLDTSTGIHGPVDSYYYPGDADAGDVARSQFYMPTRYSTLSLTDASLPETGGTQMGDLSSLIAYHFKDVPDAFERRRNHTIYGLAGAGGPAITNPYRQENRNPYVDHPEFAWSVFVDQANDSRIAIIGATVGADGSSLKDVDLGRVFVGSAVPAAQMLTLDKSGSDGTYFEVTTSGAATSSLSGRFNAFRTNQTDSKSITVGLNTSTATAGAKTGTVTVNNLDVTTGGGAGRGANDANDLFNVNLTVLDHATPSFAGASEVTSLFYDFGSVAQGSTAPTFDFDVFNFGVLPAFTADLDFDSLLSSGDASMLSTNLADSAGSLTLDGGVSHEFTATLDTATPGEFSASYTLSFSDEDLPGALTKSLTLTLMGEITAALLAGDYNRDNFVDAVDYTVWRDALGSSVAAFDGADGSGNMLVDLDDYQVWKDHFGQLAGSGAGGAAASRMTVPEPASWLIVVCTAATCLIWGRGRLAIPSR
jgi:endonuclease I